MYSSNRLQVSTAGPTCNTLRQTCIRLPHARANTKHPGREVARGSYATPVAVPPRETEQWSSFERGVCRS